MISARLLTVVLLASCSFAVAQDRTNSSNRLPQDSAGIVPFSEVLSGFTATPANPFSRFRDAAADSQSSRQSDEQLLARAQREFARSLAGHHFDPNNQHPWITISPDGKILASGVDDICFTVRSYVVARDSKDSDSVHPVSSSTCQMGSRYRLKTADVKSNFGNQ